MIASARTWIVARRTREVGVLGVALATVQAVLLGVDHGPYFFPDTGSYLFAAASLAPRRSRQIGVSVLWRALAGVWHSVLLIVLVQTVLMTIGALLVYATLRELEVRRRYAALAAGIVALSPTALFFQRMMLSEVLASVALIATVYCLVRAQRGHRLLMTGLAGFAAAAAVCTRSDLELVPIAAIAALVLLARDRRPATLLAPLLVFAVACAGLLVADLVRTKQTTGSFSLAPWSGVVAIARAAPYVDCSVPGRAPPVRKDVCAEDVRHRSYNDVIWRPGYVNSVLNDRRKARFREQNAQLLRLAAVSVEHHPGGYAMSVVHTAAADFGVTDPDRYQYSTMPLPYTAKGLRSLRLPVPGRGSHPLFGPLQTLTQGWSAVRWLIPLAVLVALVPWRRVTRRAPLIGLAAVWVASMVPAVLFGDHVPRYVFATEGVGWILVFAVGTSIAATRRSAPEPGTSR